MVTGASTADLSIMLVDARKGVSEQTRRHAYIASLLRIPHVVVCVNKMDLVGYDEAVFEQIVDDLTDWTARLGIPDVSFIPISALLGDNVVDRSIEMPWYDGPPLLYHLEHVVIAPDRDLDRGALPGPVGDPPEQRRPPRLPRLRRHSRRRRAARRRRGASCSRAVSAPRSTRSRRSTARSRPRSRRMSVTVRREGRPRHLPRGHARRGRRSARRRARARRDGVLDGRDAAAPGRAAGDQAHHAHHPRADRGARLPRRRQHARRTSPPTSSRSTRSAACACAPARR